MALCGLQEPERAFSVAIGIDTPSPSRASSWNSSVETRPRFFGVASAENQYLYRFTERRLADEGTTPLSAVKDMIGSQATKGMHAIARFSPVPSTTGVWSDSAGFLQMFETYPTVCREAGLVRDIVERLPRQDHADKQDALVCAAMARLFLDKPQCLEHPTPDAPDREGWIWRPTP